MTVRGLQSFSGRWLVIQREQRCEVNSPPVAVSLIRTTYGGADDTTPPPEDPWFCVRSAPSKCADFDGSYIVAIQAHLPMPPLPPSKVRRLLISDFRRMDQAGLEYARTLVRHARSQGWEIIVGDNPSGVDAEVITTAIEGGVTTTTWSSTGHIAGVGSRIRDAPK